MVFQDRQGSNLNRKKIKIISQAGDEIIADIERADSPTVEGTKLNAAVMNQFQKEIDDANTKSNSAVNTANTASTNANNAVTTANDAKTKATTALTNSNNAVETANAASTSASSAVNTADNASSNASSALTTANEAKSSANSAVTTANEAKTSANSAVTTANSATTTANNASTTANRADTNESTALSNSQSAVATANEAKEKALEVEGKLADRGATIKVNNVTQTEINFTSDPQTQIDNKLSLSSVLSVTYPVGSIYMSVSSTSPATLFGGTWEQLKDRFLLGAGTSYSAGATGGAATHTLTSSEMPSHTHTFTGTAGTTGNTQPTFSGNNISGSVDSVAGYSYTTSGALSVSAGQTTYGRGGTYSTDMKKLTFSATPSGTVSSHSHSFTPSGSNSSTGSGNAHNNMPPYLVVYMWKRTA